MPADQPRFQPLYEQIRQRIVERIASGEWQADAMLPSEWELAAEFAVSQGTARKALNDLTRDGWLYRRQGRGTFVAPGESEWGEGKLVSPGHFAELADPMQPELLSVARVPSGEDIARALQLRRGAMLHHVRQVWRQRGVTLAVDEILLPVERFADLDSRRLRLAGGGLYALLERQYAVRIRPLHVQYRGVLADREARTLLAAEPDEPLLSMVRLGGTVEGEPVEWRQRLLRSARWSWQTRI